KVRRLNIIQYIQRKEIDFGGAVMHPEKIERLENKLSDKQNLSLEQLLKEGDQVAERFSAVEKEAKKLFKQHEWALNEFSSFDQRWRRFWSSYGERLEKLFLFREQVIK